MKTLIIKTSALGDVVRTTCLLSELKGEIYWLTKKGTKDKSAADLLNSGKISKIFFTENNSDFEFLKQQEFDLIISLEEDFEILKHLKQIKTKKLIGVFLNNENKIDYTLESSYWFDMSLISKFGKQAADKLKKQNKKSVPEILINMLKIKFREQEYDIGIEPKNTDNTKIEKIGLINISTSVWQNKNWKYYNQLFEKLKYDGFEVYFLEMKNTVKEHIEDINNCDLIICGDTLGMHIALALKKKVIALFNCTSPDEIYTYNRLTKIISPLYEKYFYNRTFSEEAISAISLEQVYEKVKEISNQFY